MFNNRGYKVPEDKDKNNMLTNTKRDEDQNCTRFTIKELEVWQLEFIKN